MPEPLRALKRVAFALAAAAALCAASAIVHDLWASLHVPTMVTTATQHGVRVSVRGGVIRRLTPRHADLWAYVPEPQLTVQRQAGGPDAFALHLHNILCKGLAVRSDMQVHLAHAHQAQATLFIAFDDDQRHEIRFEYPAAQKRTFSIGAFSDTGGSDGYAKMQRVMEDLAAQPVAFAFSVGDTLGNAGRRMRTRWGQDVLDRYIRMSGVPVYVVTGDNDLSEWMGDSALPWQSHYGPGHYSFTYGDAHFVVLDSSWRTLSPHVLEWLAQDMKKAQAKQHFIFMHVPPFDPRPDREDCLRPPSNEQFMAIVKQYPGTRIYSGHLQIKAQWEQDGCLLRITGTAGERIRDKAAADRYYSHVRVQYGDGQVTESVVNDGPPSALRTNWCRVRYVWPVWVAQHGWEVGVSLCVALLVLVWRRRSAARRATRAKRREPVSRDHGVELQGQAMGGQGSD